MVLLELRDIEKSYRRGGWFGRGKPFRVLDRVGLSIHEGECVGLLGRSGSGKSTLGRIALGVEAPDAGEVLFEGRDFRKRLASGSKDARRAVQVVFQNCWGAVNPRMTAAWIIAEPILNFEAVSPAALKRRVGLLLEMVGLPASHADTFPHRMSGGELQRVCIARALAPKPRVVVLDEAVSSLDMIVQARIVDLLRDLGKRLGTAYLFISHDVRVVLRIADTVAVIDEGRIASVMKPSEKTSSPRGPAFDELFRAMLPPFPKTRPPLPEGDPPTPEEHHAA